MKKNIPYSVFLTLLFFLSIPKGHAQIIVLPGIQDTCYASPEFMGTKVMPHKKTSNPYHRKGSNINVTYNGFTPEAQAAFAFAVKIWENELVSSVEIRINAEFKVLGSGVLGSAGPNKFFGNIPGAPNSSIFYPSALADAISKSDREPGQPDINTNFNSNFDWYYGTDGNVPAGKYDFISVVLHELGHGLGFVGISNSGNGVGFNAGANPSVYDTYIVLSNDNTILSLGFGTTEQKSALTSNDLFFSGTNAKKANNNFKPKMFAPSTFSSGSSYSHLNESSFPAGTAHSLMTPQIGSGEVIHSLGGITKGIFKDMGWVLVDDLKNNIGVISISTSTSECDFSVNTPIKIVIENLGVNQQTNFTVSYTVKNSSNDLVDSGTLDVSSIAGFSTKELNTTVNMSVAGQYTVEVTSNLANDDDTSNDKLSKNFTSKNITLHASNITFDNSKFFELGLNWVNGNGDQRLVLMKEGSDFTAADFPADGTSPSASSNYGTVLPIGSAYPVFKGSGNSVTVRGLTGGVTYYIAILEFSCTPFRYYRANLVTQNNIITSVEDNYDKTVTVFPNPARNQAKIRFDDPGLTNVSLNITNHLGQIIQNTPNYILKKDHDIELDLSGFNKGIYFIRVEAKNKTIVNKIVVN